MAVTTVTTTMAAGVKYTVQTDSSADWSSVSNDTYFYDLATEIVYYKNADGVINDAYVSSTAWGDITGTLSSQTDLIAALDEIIEVKSDKLITENAQTGASYTLVLSDANKLVSMNNGSGNTLVIPLNSSVAFPIGTQILVKQKGAGQTIFLPTGGVIIESYLNKTISLGQYSLFTLIKTNTDTWSLGGNLH